MHALFKILSQGKVKIYYIIQTCFKVFFIIKSEFLKEFIRIAVTEAFSQQEMRSLFKWTHLLLTHRLGILIWAWSFMVMPLLQLDRNCIFPQNLLPHILLSNWKQHMLKQWGMSTAGLSYAGIKRRNVNVQNKETLKIQILWDNIPHYFMVLSCHLMLFTELSLE